MTKLTKRILGAVLMTAMITVTAACGGNKAAGAKAGGNSGGAEAKTTAEETKEQIGGSDMEQVTEDFKIGISLVQQSNNWWAKVGAFCEEYASGMGLEYKLVWADNDQAKQLSDVEDLIASGVNAIILGPVQIEGSEACIEACVNANIPVVLVGRMSASDKYTATVMASEEQFGVNQANHVMEMFPDGAKIVYLWGPITASYAQYQWKGFEATFDTSKYELLQRLEVSGDTQADGMEAMEAMLTAFEDIDAVLCSNDDLAVGAIQAIEAAGKTGDIVVFGNNATSALEYIYEGKCEFTQIKSTALMATNSIDLVLKILRGEEYENIILDPIVITSDNILTTPDPAFGGTLAEPACWSPKK